MANVRRSARALLTDPDLDEPGLREVRIFPEGFVDAARDVLRAGPPARPRLL